MTEPTTQEPINTDAMNDAVYAAIEADTAAGRCWACGVQWSTGAHLPLCPEGSDNAEA